MKELLGLREQNQSLQEQLDVALAEIEELKKTTKEPPAFVKAKVSKPKKEGPRKKRKPEHNGILNSQTYHCLITLRSLVPYEANAQASLFM